jgi:hypothetical protein
MECDGLLIGIQSFGAVVKLSFSTLESVFTVRTVGPNSDYFVDPKAKQLCSTAVFPSPSALPVGVQQSTAKH